MAASETKKARHSAIIMRLCHRITLVNLGSIVAALPLVGKYLTFEENGNLSAGRVVLTANFANFANGPCFAMLCLPDEEVS